MSRDELTYEDGIMTSILALQFQLREVEEFGARDLLINCGYSIKDMQTAQDTCICLVEQIIKNLERSLEHYQFDNSMDQ